MRRFPATISSQALRAATAMLVACLVACSEGRVTQALDQPTIAAPRPEIWVNQNPLNTMARTFGVTASGDSIRARVWSISDTIVTPFVALRDGEASIAILGLSPERTYASQVDTWRDGTLTTFPAPSFAT